MGKCNVVIDIGHGLTKVSAFHKADGKHELFSGAVFETPEGGLSEQETLQGLALHIEKLVAKSGDMTVILPIDEQNTVCTETEYPIGSAKDVSLMIKNNLSGFLPEDPSLYYHSWRLMEAYPNGQGKFQVVATRNDIMNVLYDISERRHMHFKYADITSNVLSNLGALLRSDRKYGLSANEDAAVIIDVGYKTCNVVIVGKDRILGTCLIPHNLYRLDKIILSSSPDLRKDPNIVPELLKFNSSYTSKISQYSAFVESLTSDIVRNVKQTIAGENRYHLTTVYFTGGMFKIPTLVSSVKESFGVPCFAFPMGDFMHINDKCISTPPKKAVPTMDHYAASLGALIGGN